VPLLAPVGADWQRILPDGTTLVGVLVASAERTPDTVRYDLYRLT
jgi:hypothetical protein